MSQLISAGSRCVALWKQCKAKYFQGEKNQKPFLLTILSMVPPAEPSTHQLHQHAFLLTGQLRDSCKSMALWATPELLSSSRSSWLAQVNGQLVGLREEGCQAPSGSLHLMAKLSLFTTRAHFSTSTSANRINLGCFGGNRSSSGGVSQVAWRRSI